MKYDLYNHFIEGCFWGDLNRKEGFNHVSHKRALQFLMLDRELFVKGVFVMKSSTILNTITLRFEEKQYIEQWKWKLRLKTEKPQIEWSSPIFQLSEEIIPRTIKDLTNHVKTVDKQFYGNNI